jgi:hypothetical protein
MFNNQHTHVWSKWSTIESGVSTNTQYVYGDNGPTISTNWFDTQKRTCEGCGESQLRTATAGFNGTIKEEKKNDDPKAVLPAQTDGRV